MEEKEKKEEEAPQEEIHDTEWYLDVLRATQELRMKRYRDVYSLISDEFTPRFLLPSRIHRLALQNWCVR